MTGSTAEILPITVRRITADEAELVIGLFDRYRVFYKREPDLKLAEAFIRARLENNESVIFVAFDQGEPVGFTQLYPTYSSVRAVKNWILNDLYVEQSHRKLGIGNKLIQAAISFGKEHNAKYVQLETAIDNYTAQSLYESMGFIKQQPDNDFFVYKFNIE